MSDERARPFTYSMALAVRASLAVTLIRCITANLLAATSVARAGTNRRMFYTGCGALQHSYSPGNLSSLCRFNRRSIDTRYYVPNIILG